MNCDICNDQKYIRLPRRRAMSVSLHDDDRMNPLPSSREFPCPACTTQPTTKPEETTTLEVTSRVCVLHHDEDVIPKLIECAKREDARALGADAHKRGLVHWSCTPVEGVSLDLRGRLHIYHPAAMIPLELRVQRATVERLEDLGKEIAQRVSNWGSYHGQDWLYKSQVYDSIREALEAVKRKTT